MLLIRIPADSLGGHSFETHPKMTQNRCYFFPPASAAVVKACQRTNSWLQFNGFKPNKVTSESSVSTVGGFLPLLENMLIKLDHETPRFGMKINKYLKPPPIGFDCFSQQKSFCFLKTKRLTPKTLIAEPEVKLTLIKRRSSWKKRDVDVKKRWSVIIAHWFGSNPSVRDEMWRNTVTSKHKKVNHPKAWNFDMGIVVGFSSLNVEVVPSLRTPTENIE